MSILAAQDDPLVAYRRARQELVSAAAGGALLAVGVLLVPKSPAWGSLRLVLAMLFFTGLATLIWAAGDPLLKHLRARVDLQTSDAGGEIRASGYALVDAIARQGRLYVSAGLAAVVFAALHVIAAWPIGASLRPFDGFFRLATWLALLAIPLLAFVGARGLGEIRLLQRAHQRQLDLSGFRPLDEPQIAQRAERLAGPAVIASGPGAFQAGTIDWSWDDFQKNAIVFGQTGSGKTVTVLNALLDGLLGSAQANPPEQRPAALVLDPKGDYQAKLRTLCARLGRSAELCVLDPKHPGESIRYNPLDNDDDALELAGRFGGLLALMGMKGGDDTFFIQSAKDFIQHAITLLRATEPAERPPSLAGVHELASDASALGARLFALHGKALLERIGEPVTGDAGVEALLRFTSDGELKIALNQLVPGDALAAPLQRYGRDWLAGAGAFKESAKEAIRHELRRLAPELAYAPAARLSAGSDAALAAGYLLRDWVNLPDRTRGSVQGQLTTMLNPFLGEPYRSLFSGRSTLRMGELLDAGRILYVAIPREERSEMSLVVNTLVKLDFYRQVLMRRGKARPSLFFCDEFQSLFTSDEGRGDAPFFSRSRESRHANVVATQNLPGLLLSTQREEAVRNFLSNCAVKIFLRNTDGKTNEFASKDVFGEYDALIVNPSMQVGGQGSFDAARQQLGAGETLQRMPRVRPERFTQLAIPDVGAGVPFAEALVHLGSRGTVEMHRLRFKVHPLDA
ncbi:MAG: TraM recognition domain-containing protein [Zoogloeaceae bacterium]|nr:TraM recognition domain-containing protein [Zoogloeaceae bacterium]